MINHCLMPITSTKKWYNINMNSYVKRWEFVKSIYNFIKTIRPYVNNEYYYTTNKKISWIPNTTDDQEAIQWLVTIQWYKYITHTETNNTIWFNRNSTISSKEIYDTLSYILNLHDDNDIYFKSLWNRESMKSTIKRVQYTTLIRKILEQYDRVSLGNNIISLQNIQSRINNWSNQQEELWLIYTLLQEKDPNEFEKNGLSKRYLLNDISTLLNNWEFNKKSVVSVSLANIVNKANFQQGSSNNRKERNIQLFKKMSY
jgi:hypothetical protein